MPLRRDRMAQRNAREGVRTLSGRCDRSNMQHLAPMGQPAPSELGVRVPPDASFHDWRRLGRQLGRMHRASWWCLGDWIVEGRRRGYPGRGTVYRDALDATGLAYQSLKNASRVARAFPLERRRAKLSWEHHEIVAALPRAEQDDWLDQAEWNGWTASELRLRRRRARALPPARRNGDARQLELTARDEQAATTATDLEIRLLIDGARRERWEAAAASTGFVDVVEWLVATADQAASDAQRRAESDAAAIAA